MMTSSMVWMTRRNDTTSGVLNQAAAQAGLRRALGKWDLTAIGVNQVLGASMFAMPATIAAAVGAWAPWMVAAVGLASLMIALCFAEVGSRFEGTGGPYLYTRAAFGRFAAFEVGWMLWFTRAASWAAVVNVLVTSLGFYWPTVTDGWPRVALITTIIVTIAVVNIRGIRQSSLVVNALTIGKVVPLVVFVVAGIFFVQPEVLVPTAGVSLAALSTSGLALIYAFGGYEVVSVPAGEANNPRRDVPFALIMTIVIVTAIMTLIQAVAQGTLPDIARSTTPLADASSVFLGAAGAALITVGAVLSTTGNNMGGALSGSRNLFALAEQGDLPRFFGVVHPQFRTPVNAIVFTAAVALVLGLSGRFAALALASAISRLIVYVFTCAATLRLRQPQFETLVQPPRFVVPFGPLIPAAALVVAFTILAGARRDQLIAGVVALSAGAVLYLVAIGSQEVRRK
jgi:basic amino acid/polyamine antiporter, APA family